MGFLINSWMLILFLLLAAAIYIGVAVTMGVMVYRDAKARGMEPWLWTLISVFAPFFIGLLVYLAVRSAIMLAVFMANAGGAWDNAKKYIESGKLGGKGSDAHKAAVTGDTVGDPFKDTAGPAMDILIKLMSVISLILAPILMQMTPLLDFLFH